MAIKIEVDTGLKVPGKSKVWIEGLLACLVPRQTLRGLDRIRLVDSISNPRLKNLDQKTDLPSLSSEAGCSTSMARGSSRRFDSQRKVTQAILPRRSEETLRLLFFRWWDSTTI